ncbi:MAG TPA: Hsp20/alpha crystallin family protein [Alphaproteobacteria bacterium]|nr:Hsp20/alpha crystallin family protein [Alphaproteobacteria bacterium]
MAMPPRGSGPPRDAGLWMWAEACARLDQAERLQRQFFHPGPVGPSGPAWQPPVDLYETNEAYHIVVALPGVPPEAVEVAVEDGVLVVGGERGLLPAAAVIHRLELPHGRFERRIELPRRPLRLDRHELAHGCLVIVLTKL